MSKTSPSAIHGPTLHHLDQLIEQLLDGVILIDPTGVILSANAAALRMHGADKLSELGTTIEEYAQRFTVRSERGERLKRSNYPLFRLLAGDRFPDLVVQVAPLGDETRWVHQVRDVAMDEDGGDPDCLALVISDVSERFDAQARFEAMFMANPAPALIVRLSDQRVVRSNAGFLALSGFDPDDLIGKSLFDLDLLSHTADAASVKEHVKKGEVISQTEAEMPVADGSRRLVLFAGQPIDVTGEDAMLLTFADLEPRRQAQDALAASERHLSALFEMAPVAMIVTEDDEHHIVNVNEAFRQLTGYTADAAVGKSASELALWVDVEQGDALDRRVLEKGSVHNADGKVRSESGDELDCLVSAETISVHGAPCILWLFQDITERRRTETELIEAIDAVMKDASWLSRSILDRLANLRRPSLGSATVDLTPREREILELICDDFDDAAIANDLKLSRNTVRNHVARLYAKIGVNRRSGAVVWGRERGMGRLRE